MTKVINSQKLENLFPKQFWLYTTEGVDLLDDLEHDHEFELTEIGYKGKDCDGFQKWVIEFIDNDGDKIKAYFYNEDAFKDAEKKLLENIELI